MISRSARFNIIAGVVLFAAACAPPMTPIAAQAPVDTVTRSLARYCGNKTSSITAYMRPACRNYPKLKASVPIDTTHHAPPVDTTTPKSPADTLKPLPPPPSPGHPHEPPGFAPLVQPLSGDTMPLTIYGGGAAYEIGWLQNGTGATVVVDSSVPYASKKVLQSSFPAGMGGGGAPSDVWTASPTNPSNWPFAAQPRHAMAMYESFLYKLSPDFPINLIANKVMYNHTWYDALGGNQHAPVITMAQATSDYGTQFTAPIWPAACLQGVTGVDGKLFAGCLYEWSDADPLKWTQVKRGVWHHWETLYELNTKGQYDGSAQIWLDGKLIINFVHRIKFTDEQEWWANAYWAPVYGGAGSIPTNAAPISYHRLKDLYVSGSKDGARVSFTAPLARAARPQIMTIRGLSAKTDTTGAPKPPTKKR